MTFGVTALGSVHQAGEVQVEVALSRELSQR